MKYLIIFTFLLISCINAKSVNFESKLPIIIINTGIQTIPDEPKIWGSMGIIYNGDSKINRSNDPINGYNGYIGIETRGSTSQEFPKKSYAIKTRKSNGDENNVSILGLPEEHDWILYGPYSDKSLMRNALIFELSRQMGNYASRTVFCEVILNNEYQGIYVLMEKLKRDKNRIDIAKLKDTDISGDELTGGYVIKIDKLSGFITRGWQSIFPPFDNAWQRIFYQYHHPNPRNMPLEQIVYIRSWIFELETILFGEMGENIDTGYDWIDLDSAVDYFLLNELAKNKDAYFASIYMYKNKDSIDPRLHMGPVWDFNLSIGNNYDDEMRSYEGWRFEIPLIQWELDNSILKGPFWFEMLWNDMQFRIKFIERWNQLRNSIFSKENINNIIDNYHNQLRDASQRNFLRWDILGTAVWPITFYDHDNYVLDTFEEEVEFLKSWLNFRSNWIESAINNLVQFDYIPPSIPYNFDYLVNQGCISLSWDKNAEPDLKNYILYKSTGQNTQLDSLTTIDKSITVYNDSNIVSHSIYNYQICSVDSNGNRSDRTQELSILSLDIDIVNELHNYSLHQNIPNPFNPSTTITYSLSVESSVSITIYDLAGNRINELISSIQKLGTHSIQWNGTDRQGKAVPAGIYFYQLQVDNFVETKKMILFR